MENPKLSENENTLIIDGVEYEFIESSRLEPCCHCDLNSLSNCSNAPCTTFERIDRKYGIFKIKQ